MELTPRYFEFEGFRLDRGRRLLVDAAGEPVGLTTKAFDTLVYFLQHPGEVIDRATLLDAVWPNAVVDENNLSQAIAVLRRALGQELIITVARQGYQFVADVRAVDGPGPEVGRVAEDGSEGPLSAGSEAGRARAETAPVFRSFLRRRHLVAVTSATALVAALAIGVTLISDEETYDPAEPQASEPVSGASFGAPLARSPPRVAVLPCENFGPSPDDPLSGSAFHIELLNRLSNLSGLHVIARSSVMQYAEARPPMSEIASELNVAAVMECSVRSAGGRVVITASLIDSVTNVPIWSDQYPMDSEDLTETIASQADIAMNIADQLRAEISPAEQRKIEALPTESFEAYAHFIRAQSLVPESGNASQAYFALIDQAIEADPEFALAYAHRASAHMGRVRLASVSPSAGVDLDAELELLRRDAERALAIAPDLGPAHALLAAFNLFRGDTDVARALLARALDLAPNDRSVLGIGIFFHLSEGRPARARELLDRYARLDPRGFDGYVFYMAGDLDTAAERARRVVESNPALAIARADLGYYEALRGNRDRAVHNLRIADGLDTDFPGAGGRGGFLARLAYAYGRLGLHDDAQDAFDRLNAIVTDKRQLNAVAWLTAYLGIGDLGRALEWATLAASSPLPPGPMPQLELMLNTFHDPVLERPEFLELRVRLGYRDESVAPTTAR